MRRYNEESNTHPLDELKDSGIYKVLLSTGETTVAQLDKRSEDINNSIFWLIGSDYSFYWHEAEDVSDREWTILDVSPVLVV
jgi:hypothetical protein